MTSSDALVIGTQVEVVVVACVKTCCGGSVQRYETEITVQGTVTAVYEACFALQTRELGRLGTILAEHKDLLEVRPIVD